MINRHTRELDALSLQKILSTPTYRPRVLACKMISGNDRNCVYSFITANDDGDYVVNSVPLRRVSLVENGYAASGKITTYPRTYETMHDAFMIMESMRIGFKSVSGPPPLSSAMFSLNEFGVNPSPLIDDMLREWNSTQTIAPLRYAVYNPQRNEIEVSFQDPSAHNDEPHQLELKRMIGKELSSLFSDNHHPRADSSSDTAGRYTRRPKNRRTFNMSLITINLQDNSVASQSAAKAPTYAFGKISGATELILPSSLRPVLSSVKANLTKSKADRTKANALAIRLDAVNISLKDADATPARKVKLKATAKDLKAQISDLRKSSTASLSAANKALRANGLKDFTPAIDSDILDSVKKLAKADVTAFRVANKRGSFTPRYISDAKFDALVQPKAPAKAPAKTAAKAPAKPAAKSSKAVVAPKYDSVMDILEALDDVRDEAAFTASMGFDPAQTEIKACLLNGCTGVYANFNNDHVLNIFITETQYINDAPHLEGAGKFTVCKLWAPEGAMFDEPEVRAKQLGKFNSYASAWAAFAKAVVEQSNK